ncbi:hypothetical protein D3C81_1805150 [compost metagenome]
MRFKRFPTPQSPWEALASAFGASGQAADAMVSVGRVMGDPAAQAMLNQVEAERLRSRGAVVLADQPAF